MNGCSKCRVYDFPCITLLAVCLLLFTICTFIKNKKPAYLKVQENKKK